ncbi:MAG: MotA/TolQ/ExbB proton channel family protein [Planctomycetales bacterium]
MNIQTLIDLANNSVYPAQGLMALYGVFCVILVLRRIRQKGFGSHQAAEQFLEETRADLAERRFDDIAQRCDSPRYWAKAVPQLMLVALANQDRDRAGLRRLLAEKFEREVLADLEYRMSWINTVIKSEPMLGLLGTVLGMISAFGKIAGSGKSGVDPQTLANDISFALWTTAIGLIIAIPLIVCMSMIQVRLSRMQDGVQQYLGEFLEAFDAARQPPKGR